MTVHGSASPFVSSPRNFVVFRRERARLSFRGALQTVKPQTMATVG